MILYNIPQPIKRDSKAVFSTDVLIVDTYGQTPVGTQALCSEFSLDSQIFAT